MSFGLLRKKKNQKKEFGGKKMNTRNDLKNPKAITNQTRAEGKMGLIIPKALGEF